MASRPPPVLDIMTRPRTLLLLGATGRLGRAVLPTARQDWLVDGPTRAELNLSSLSVEDWREEMGRRAPDVVLNCAAMADVDGCEREPEAADEVNSRAPQRLARGAAQAGVPLVHISSDYVFGDASGPFAEDARRGPVQHYGRSKRRGEEAVLSVGGRAAVVRVSWLFGATSSTFADYVLGQVDGSGRPVGVHTLQRSRPTYLGALVPWLLAAAARLADGDDVPPILLDPATQAADERGRPVPKMAPLRVEGEAEWTLLPGAHAADGALPTELSFPLTQLWQVERPGPALSLYRLTADEE